MKIKRRHLSNSLEIWLMSTLQLGPGVGDVFYVAAADSQYDIWLKQQGVDGDHLLHTVAAAYAATTGDRNDCILKMPGLETVTASLAWSKSRTHLIGLGGPQHKGYESGTGLTTSTANVGSVINNTGVNNQFHNVTLMNQGADADNVTAFKNAGYGTRLIGDQIIGCAAATQAVTALNSSIEIAEGGYYFYAENCNFGSTDFGTLGADTAAVLVFSNTTAASAPSDGKFVNCNFGAQIDATTRCLIYSRRLGLDRDWIFDRCEFYAFAANHAYTMAQVVTNEANPTTYDMVFKDCVGINVTGWRTDSNGCCWTTQPAGNEKGGVAVVTG
jgi:hypothetical protein